MGYNTTMMVLNDSLHDIEKNPERFVKQIVDGIHEGGYNGNHVQVMPTAHADTPRLYHTHANMMLDLSPWSHKTMEYATSDREHLRDMVDAAIQNAEYYLKKLKERILEERTKLEEQDK